MSLRASKASQDPAPPTVGTSSDAPPQADRIYVDNSNIAELKSTCDDAVERILTRPSQLLAPGPSVSPKATSPNSSSADLTSSSAQQDGTQSGDSSSPSSYPPFKASHFHSDLRLALGYIGAAIIIAVSAWSYLIEKSWQKNKAPTAWAVGAYLVLSGISAIDAHLQGDCIFKGRRKMLSKRIETETLTICSANLPKPTLSNDVDGRFGRRWIVPSVYALSVEYARRSNGGKSLLRKANKRVELGHLGEWFTQEGEFVEDVFERRLVAALQRAWGSEDDGAITGNNDGDAAE